MEVQQSGRWARAYGGALFMQSSVPGLIWTATCGTAACRILVCDLAVQHGLGGGIIHSFFIGQECHQALLQGAKAAFDLALGLRAGSYQVGDAQCGESSLEFRTRIEIVGCRDVAKEAQTIGVDSQRQLILQEKPTKVFEVIPSGIRGDKEGP